MAALTPKLVYSEGTHMRFAVYDVTNATDADTISVATEFSRVITAATFNLSRSQTYDAPGVSGTTITLNEAGSANDELRVVVIGPSAA